MKFRGAIELQGIFATLFHNACLFTNGAVRISVRVLLSLRYGSAYWRSVSVHSCRVQ